MRLRILPAVVPGLLVLAIAIVLGAWLCRDLARRRTERAPLESGPEAGLPAGKAGPEAGEPAGTSEIAARGPWTIIGRVVRSGDRPARGVQVALVPGPKAEAGKRSPARNTATGDDGRFAFRGVPAPARLRVVVDDPGSAIAIRDIELEKPEGIDSDDPEAATEDLGDIELGLPATLVVKLKGKDEVPIEDGTVSGQPDCRSDGRRIFEDRGGGEHVLERAPRGTFNVRAAAPHHLGAEEQVELPRDEPLVLHLEEGQRIAGTVRATDGTPIAGAKVWVEEGSEEDEYPTSITDPSGRFLFDTLSKAEHYVKVEATGFLPEGKWVEAGEESFEFWLIREVTASGKVVDSETGEPLAGAMVRSSSDSGENNADSETDRQGIFEIKGIHSGNVEIHASLTGYISAQAGPFEVEPGDRIADIVLEIRQGAELRGEVLDAATRLPVKAEVRAYGQSEMGNHDSGTDPGGRFILQGLPDGNYKVQASSDEGESETVDVAVTRDSPAQVTLLVARMASISGRVIGLDGNPVAGAKVLLDRKEGTTDEKGAYTFRRVTPGVYDLIAAKRESGIPGSVKGIRIEGNESQEGIDIRLSEGGKIRGRILDEEGQPIEHASVFFQAEDSGSRIMRFESREGMTTTSANGSFELLHLAGSYKIKASAGGLRPSAEKSIDVEDGETVEGIEIVLRKGAALEGRVMDAEGNPIADASVYIEGRGTETEEDGSFRVEGLQPGKTWVSAFAKGFAPKGEEAEVPGEVTIRLERVALIIGRVRAGERQVFPEGSVLAIRHPAPGKESEEENTENEAPIDKTGRFRISNLPPGSYRLVASVPGFAPTSLEIPLQAGERREDVEIDLRSGGSIEGVVVEAGTGEPVEGADVEVLRARGIIEGDLPSARTDGEGKFAIPNLPEGEVEIWIFDHGHVTLALGRIKVREGAAAAVRAELSAGGTIVGTVTRSGKPAQGIEVQVEGSGSSSTSRSARTSEDGRFEIRGLPPGRRFLTASWRPPDRDGVGPGLEIREAVTVVEGRTVEVHLALDPVRIAGIVTAGGGPARGFRVRAEGAATGIAGRPARTDRAGGYALDLPGPGSYILIISGPDRRQFREAVEVPPGIAEIRKDLHVPSAEIAGIVVDEATGKPIEDVELMAFPAGLASPSAILSDGAAQGKAVSDEDGRFSIPLPPGRYFLRASAYSYAVEEIDGIDAGRGKGAGIRIALEPAAKFRIEVADERGETVTDARAILRDGRRPPILLDIFSEDPEYIYGVPTGSYLFTVGHRSLAPARLQMQVPPPGPIQVVLGRGGALTIEVVDGAGARVGGARVAAIDAGGTDAAEEWAYLAGSWRMEALHAITSVDGTFAIAHAAPGAYRVSAQRGAARSAEEKVQVEVGRPATVRLVLKE